MFDERDSVPSFILENYNDSWYADGIDEVDVSDVELVD